MVQRKALLGQSQWRAAAEGAAGSAAEVEAVLLLAAVCALEAGLNVHPLVPKLAAEDCLP